jgi:hypothetical protein
VRELEFSPGQDPRRNCWVKGFIKDAEGPILKLGHDFSGKDPISGDSLLTLCSLSSDDVFRFSSRDILDLIHDEKEEEKG